MTDDAPTPLEEALTALSAAYREFAAASLAAARIPDLVSIIDRLVRHGRP